MREKKEGNQGREEMLVPWVSYHFFARFDCKVKKNQICFSDEYTFYSLLFLVVLASQDFSGLSPVLFLTCSSFLSLSLFSHSKLQWHKKAAAGTFCEDKKKAVYIVSHHLWCSPFFVSLSLSSDRILLNVRETRMRKVNNDAGDEEKNNLSPQERPGDERKTEAMREKRGVWGQTFKSSHLSSHSILSLSLSFPLFPPPPDSSSRPAADVSFIHG